MIVVTDRLSAFDAVVGTIPFKGQVLNQLAQFWFEITRDLAPNHMARVPESQRHGRARVHAVAAQQRERRLFVVIMDDAHQRCDIGAGGKRIAQKAAADGDDPPCEPSALEA